ncbi:homeodomain interacting protein kinase [Anaeramoeba flamelloides]|uniref:Homeodomain interacting protein kinase n=1 Tax=Anaeramoeba flamelloides TaxID=1746091 RepID=A0ABQ8XLD9_9EUKA|nr:homeodomain interacting protein kinase [Anaeramoeba flamelloides]
MSRRNHRKLPPLKKNDPPIVFSDNCFQFISKGTTKKNKEKKETKNSNKKKTLLLKKASTNLISTYYRCNNEFLYRRKMNPKRFITANHKPRRNQGFDNSDYELILKVDDIFVGRKDKYRGFSMKIIKKLSTQLLDSLILLYDTGIIHSDLKPENILLEHPKKTDIKIIDFGSACYCHQTNADYIQSRFYRAPEVIIKARYSQAIDMWSFGCIVAELFLGLPLFPGINEYEQLFRIIETIGSIPIKILNKGRVTTKYYNITDEEFIFKSIEQFSIENQIRATERRKYFNDTTLTDIILKAPYRKKLQKLEIQKEIRDRTTLLHFLIGVLQIDPDRRWTPKEAMQHPFITGEDFHPNFRPKQTRERIHYTLPKENTFNKNFNPKLQKLQKTELLKKKQENSKNKSKIICEKQFSSQKRQSPKKKMRTRNLTRTRALSRKQNIPTNRKSKHLESLQINNTRNNSQILSQTSETSSLSERELIPNFNLSGRFNSKSFLMPRSPQRFDSSSESDSSEFELYRNIRRAKRSFGFGFVSSSGTEEDFSTIKTKKKRGNKIKSWSDSREDPFSPEKNNDEIEIDLMNNPQNLRFAEKLNLNDKTTTTTTTTTTNSTNSTVLNKNTNSKTITISKSTSLITIKKKKRKKKYSKLKKKRNRLRKKKIRSHSFKSSNLIKTTTFNTPPQEEPIEITMKEPSSPRKKKKKKKSEKKKKKKKKKNQSNN